MRAGPGTGRSTVKPGSGRSPGPAQPSVCQWPECRKAPSPSSHLCVAHWHESDRCGLRGVPPSERTVEIEIDRTRWDEAVARLKKALSKT